MDSNSVILILNFILQIIQMFDHSFLQRLKSSKCLCGEIELNNDNQDLKKQNTNNKI